jgi:hypothetical protein
VEKDSKPDFAGSRVLKTAKLDRSGKPLSIYGLPRQSQPHERLFVPIFQIPSAIPRGAIRHVLAAH